MEPTNAVDLINVVKLTGPMGLLLVGVGWFLYNFFRHYFAREERREQRLSDRLAMVEDYQRTTLTDLVAENTIAQRETLTALSKLADIIEKRDNERLLSTQEPHHVGSH